MIATHPVGVKVLAFSGAFPPGGSAVRSSRRVFQPERHFFVFDMPLLMIGYILRLRLTEPRREVGGGLSIIECLDRVAHNKRQIQLDHHRRRRRIF